MTLVTRVWRHTSWADRFILKVIAFISAVAVLAYLYDLVSTKTNKTVSIGHWATLVKVPEQILPGIYQVEFRLVEYAISTAVVGEDVISTNQWRVGDKILVHSFVGKDYEGRPLYQYGVTHWDPQTNASMARVGK